MASEFIHQLEVSEADLDDLKHVNNVVYLQWVQRVAGMHWFSKAGRNHGVLWVVRKHEIEYFKPAFLGDLLQLKTWVESMEGIVSLRKVAVYRGETLICSCTSHWVMLDEKTLRPRRIPDVIAQLF